MQAAAERRLNEKGTGVKMKTLYLDCGMGAAGDMLSAALVELLPDPDAFVETMNELGIPGVRIRKERAVKCGITGTHMSVTVHGMEESEEIYGHVHSQEGIHTQEEIHSHGHEHTHEEIHSHSHEHAHEEIHSHSHEHAHEAMHSGKVTDTHSHGQHHVGEHHHSSMHEIEHLVRKLRVPGKVQEDILAVYGLIAEAESHAHGVPVTEIHFHEVGTMDAVADITAVCMLMNELAPDQVVVSPVHVGSGQVKCAHGILPVPAPATAFLLKDVPIYGGNIQGELCTPTGAALVKYFADQFGDMPVMRTQAIGYGMGKKDFQAANCVRAMLGETQERTDEVSELSCNVDDMTAEAVGFAMERLFEGGAKEVYTVPIGMKKSRPGTLIRVICGRQDRENMINLLFRHTTTIGIRESVAHRYVLERKVESMQTPYGEVRRKVSSGYGVIRSKYEYEDLSRIARERNVSFREAEKLIDKDRQRTV